MKEEKTQDQIIEKIRKLLALSESDNPHEAELALSHAHRLMAKHQITSLEPEEEPIMELKIDETTKSISGLRRILAGEMSKFYGCKVILGFEVGGVRRMRFVGTPLNAQIFKESFEFAWKAYRKYSDEFLKTVEGSKSYRIAMRKTYFRGFVDGITNEITRSMNEYAIVVKVPEKVEEMMSNLRKASPVYMSSAYAPEARQRGYSDGSFAQRNKATTLN